MPRMFRIWAKKEKKVNRKSHSFWNNSENWVSSKVVPDGDLQGAAQRLLGRLSTLFH